MVASIVVRTKIAKFGPGQFNFVLAKTEIPVFGPEQHHPARGDSGSSTDWACLVLECPSLPGSCTIIGVLVHEYW